MAKKKKVDERTVEVPRGDNSYREAQEAVKKVSGFDHCVCTRAKLIGERRDKVEYEFYVGNDLGAIQAQIFDIQMQNERSL